MLHPRNGHLERKNGNCFHLNAVTTDEHTDSPVQTGDATQVHAVTIHRNALPTHLDGVTIRLNAVTMHLNEMPKAFVAAAEGWKWKPVDPRRKPRPSPFSPYETVRPRPSPGVVDALPHQPNPSFTQLNVLSRHAPAGVHQLGMPSSGLCSVGAGADASTSRAGAHAVMSHRRAGGTARLGKGDGTRDGQDQDRFHRRGVSLARIRSCRRGKLQFIQLKDTSTFTADSDLRVTPRVPSNSGRLTQTHP